MLVVYGKCVYVSSIWKVCREWAGGGSFEFLPWADLS